MLAVVLLDIGSLNAIQLSAAREISRRFLTVE